MVASSSAITRNRLGALEFPDATCRSGPIALMAAPMSCRRKMPAAVSPLRRRARSRVQVHRDALAQIPVTAANLHQALLEWLTLSEVGSARDRSFVFRCKIDMGCQSSQTKRHQACGSRTFRYGVRHINYGLRRLADRHSGDDFVGLGIDGSQGIRVLQTDVHASAIARRPNSVWQGADSL